MGAGKSYIAAVIAQYYYQKNMKAAIVTSKPILVSQYNRMLGKARFHITVLTIEQALSDQDKFEVFIIDEAD